MKFRKKPILFNGEMVRAILEGRKTQTRRIVKPQPTNPDPEGLAYFDAYNGGPQWNWWTKDNRQYLGEIFRCPYGKVGDHLWVRETFQLIHAKDAKFPNYDTGEGYAVRYMATDEPVEYYDVNRDEISTAAKPSIHMPRWASRITLEITNIRVERLQEISEQDAKAEGVKPLYNQESPYNESYKESFKRLWNNLAGQNSPDWYGNPWVWVIEFKKVN